MTSLSARSRRQGADTAIWWQPPELTPKRRPARTALGAIFIATISDMLLLRGYSTGGQILVRGIIVVVVVVLTNLRERNR